MARPTSPLLSGDKIARAALGLVDTTGELTMARLADALGVRPSSLYNHVAGRAEVVEAMRALVFTEPPIDLSGDDPATTLPRVLRAYRDAFARHPRLVPMLTAHTVAAPEVLAIYSALARLLSRSGIPDDRLLDAVTILDSYVIGAALDAVAPEQVWADSDVAGAELRAALAEAPAGHERADRSFELGLLVVLSGLGSLHA